MIPFYAAAAALFVLALLHLDLRIRHDRCKRTLDRVAIERDEARASLWEASQPDATPSSPVGDQLPLLLLDRPAPFTIRDLLLKPDADA